MWGVSRKALPLSFADTSGVWSRAHDVKDRSLREHEAGRISGEKSSAFFSAGHAGKALGVLQNGNLDFSL